MCNSLEPAKPCLSVVVPAYNEEKTLATIIEKLLSIPFLKQVVIVDDGSTDRTSEIADNLAMKNPRILTVHHTKNKGKMEALKTGFLHSTGAIVVVQDADLEYDPVF